MDDINYFVCTLGQAVKINNEFPHSFGTINDFLDHQASVIPHAPAVGFPIPSKDEPNGQWKYKIFTQSPQCQPSAIAHLCKTCDVTFLVHDEAYAGVAQQSASVADQELETVSIPKQLIGDLSRNCASGVELSPFNLLSQTNEQPSASDTAFLFHTSGTSSGLPKPIPQTHHGAIGVLPCLSDGHRKATFTTTPLYHGGISDCFRAWTSGALIWLFPGKDVPITASNILKCLGCAGRAQVSDKADLHTYRINPPPVRYFSSVPYILQMVSAEPEGLKMLQSMEIVGVGGAALPQDVGDSLVRSGVNLVSRFGSAECGFLLSSHRNYEKDQEWQYLRSHGSNLLVFEPQQDESGLSELVIRPEWPHMAKWNREDGSFATADLFVPHPRIEDAWKYHSRADSQLTLITGKKFDPAPLEAAMASSELLSDVLIFGNGMKCPGALLFRSEAAKEMDTGRLLDEVWPAIDRLNKEGQAHTRLSRSVLIVMNFGAPGLEKSSKGTILRAQAEKRYEREIQGAYDPSEADIDGNESQPREVVPDHEIPTAILEIVKTVLGTNDQIPEDADLFSYGVDSVACMAIRAKLQLWKFLIDIRKGRKIDAEDEIQLMKDVVTQYSDFSKPPQAAGSFGGSIDNAEKLQRQNTENHIEHVLLTGATGALGAHILHLLRSSPTISRITCLVRAASPLAAHERVLKSLLARGRPGLPPFVPTPHSSSPSSPVSATKPPPSTSSSRNDSATITPEIVCLPTTLSNPTLGLESSTYSTLATTTTLIIHAAWAVNFTARLRSFEKDHIAGLFHLLNLSLTCKQQPRFLFLSSTACVTNKPAVDYPIAESISHNPDDTSPLGYSRSKWIAENICQRFHSHVSSSPPYPLKIAVLRIGQLTSDTKRGVWNMSEAWPLMLSTAPVLHALPDLGAQVLDWLPVDSAAEAVLQVADAMKGKTGMREGCEVYHILNPSTITTWSDLLQCIKINSPELKIEILPPRRWLYKLEGFEGELPAKKLLGLWKGAFAREKDGQDNQRITFDVSISQVMSATMRDVKPLDEEFLGRMWKWIHMQTSNGHTK
ncbi:MAG: hypothetical protein Q9166_005643 [cf. Caloplaca sp. 2 TL-2023]